MKLSEILKYVQKMKLQISGTVLYAAVLSRK